MLNSSGPKRKEPSLDCSYVRVLLNAGWVSDNFSPPPSLSRDKISTYLCEVTDHVGLWSFAEPAFPLNCQLSEGQLWLFSHLSGPASAWPRGGLVWMNWFIKELGLESVLWVLLELFPLPHPATGSSHQWGPVAQAETQMAKAAGELT